MTIAYDLKIGASVLTADGEVGRLRCIVVDPESDVVTHLVVERATPDGIFLHLTSQEVAR